MKRAYKERHIALGYTNGAHGPVIMNPKDKDKTRAWNILDNVVTIGYDDSHDRRLAALKAIHTTATVTSASNKFNAVVETNTVIGNLPASRVDSRNINQHKKDKFLDFLAIETKITPDNNYEMKIIFAGDSIIRVISEVIEVTLDDQGEAWDTKNKPKHKVI